MNKTAIDLMMLPLLGIGAAVGFGNGAESIKMDLAGLVADDGAVVNSPNGCEPAAEDSSGLQSKEFRSSGNRARSGNRSISTAVCALRWARALHGIVAAAAITDRSSTGTMGHEAKEIGQSAPPT